jgi:hypothetical protein
VLVLVGGKMVMVGSTLLVGGAVGAGAWVVVGAGPVETTRVTVLFRSSGVPAAGSVRMTVPAS